MMQRYMITGVLAAVLFAAPAAGQQRNAGQDRPAPQQRSAPQQRNLATRGDSAARAQLELRAQQRLGRMLQQRLGLTAEQVQRLTPVRARNEERRRALIQQEREARAILRAELATGDSANQARVAQQLDRLLELQRNRLALLQDEQQELAAFLTPVQRAQYQGVQEALRRQLQGAQQRGRVERAQRPR